MKKLKGIPLPDGQFVYVSDDDLGINNPFWGYCWNWRDKIHYFNNGLNENARSRNGIQKIIASKLFIDESIPLIEISDKEIEQKASEYTFCYPGEQSEDEQQMRYSGYYNGYKAAKEKYCFSEEDIIAYKNFWLKQDIEYFDNTEKGDVYKDKKKNILTEQDLVAKFISLKQQQLPLEIEVEYEKYETSEIGKFEKGLLQDSYSPYPRNPPDKWYNWRPKLNSQGKLEVKL